jgi:hypothetical protein
MHRTFEPYATSSQWKLFTGEQDIVPLTIAGEQDFRVRILSRQPIADVPMWFAHFKQEHFKQERHKLPAYQKK